MQNKNSDHSGLKKGLIFEEKRSFSQQDFDDFACLSGDNNPIHTDPVYAAKTSFGSTVAHGMLLYTGLSSALLNFIPSAKQLKHEMIFPTGTIAEETVCYRFEVLSFNASSKEARLKIEMLRPNGQLGLDGETLIKLEE